MIIRHPARRFVPDSLNPGEFAQLDPLYHALLDRPIASVADLESWLLDLSELSAIVDEYGNRRYVEKSCHTDNAQLEKAYLRFIQEIEPQIKPLFFQLQKKFVSCPFQKSLTGRRHEILARKWQTDVGLFREENVPLEAECARIGNEYDKLSGAMTVFFQGREHTLQQMQRYQEMPDRTTRQWAWEIVANRRLVDRTRIEDIFDQLLPHRETIARNAGLPDYRAYCWQTYKRFDYTPDDCLRFADAIAEISVPLVRKLDQSRKAALGVPSLRPWDIAVDPMNREPLKPFAEPQIDRFIAQTHSIFTRLSPSLADDFDSLRRNGNLDLDSRTGKAPGGYQATFEDVGQPFIFMNAAGLQRDVEVLLHEAGHAFHTLAARPEPLMFLRSAPMEFCEVASMSMELLGSDHFDQFYNCRADAARGKRTMLEGIIRFFPWMTTIDSFQHWIYTHPGHTRAARRDCWLSLQQRFGRDLDWTGYEPVRECSWQQQLHLFHYPFYYIEYGIAQLGALQLWLRSRQDMHAALANYRAALALGGTRSLPELFNAAGLTFDLSARTLRPLMDAIAEELETLPE
ncbi:MAG: M3 family oligoendopeptidase [Tepidisphaeraceae bacterium]